MSWRAGLIVTWAVAVIALYLQGWGARGALLAHQGPRLVIIAAILLGAWVVGDALLARLREDLPAPRAFRVAAGLAALSYAWLLFSAVGLLRAGLAWGLLVALAAAAALVIVRRLREPRSRCDDAPDDGRPALLPAALALVGLVLVVPMVLAPPASTDELTYHLTVPKWTIAAGHLLALPRIAHSAFPFQVEMLYTWALLLGQPVVAKLIHFSMGLCAVAIAACAARREGTRPAGAMAAAMLLLTPVFLLNMAWAWVDAATALYVLCGSLLLLRLRQTWSLPLAIASGLAWGMALGTKYTAALYFALALICCLWERRPSAPLALRVKRVALVGALAVLLVSPYLARNTVIHGNPVHPIGDRAWGRGTLANERAFYTESGERGSMLERLKGPLAYSLWNQRSDDTLGFLPLLLAPVLLLVRLPSDARRLHVMGLVAALALSMSAGGSVRYQLPALVLLAVPIGIQLAAWWITTRAARLAVGMTLLLAAATSLPILAFHDRQLFDPLAVAVGYESEGAYLDRMEPNHAILRRLNDDAPDGTKVLALGGDRLFWLDRPVIASSVLDVSIARDWAREAGSPEAFAARLRAEGVTHVLFARDEFQLEVRDREAGWSAADLAVLDGALERVLVKDVRNGEFELYLVP